MTSRGWDCKWTTEPCGISAGGDAQEVTPWRRYQVMEGVAMGGASRLWSSWNLGSRAGNVLVKLGPGQGWRLVLVAQVVRAGRDGSRLRLEKSLLGVDSLGKVGYRELWERGREDQGRRGGTGLRLPGVGHGWSWWAPEPWRSGVKGGAWALR